MLEEQIAEKLCGIWKRLLGNIKVSYTSNFHELGGDEFLFCALKNLIEQEFSVEIKYVQQPLFFYQQVALIKKMIGGSKDNVIIAFNDKAASPAIIFIHPLGGTVFNYKKLVTRLNTDKAIFAIQDRFFYEHEMSYISLSEQARFYVEQVKNKVESKELILVGHSSGGTIAFEMAEQLSSMSYVVKHLVLFDSWVDVPLDVGLRDSFKKIMLRQTDKLCPEKFFNAQFTLEDWLEILWQRMELLLRYRPKENLEIKATLFIAEEIIDEYKIDTSLAEKWKKYIKQLQIITALGNHETMLDDKNLFPIVDYLNDLFRSY